MVYNFHESFKKKTYNLNTKAGVSFLLKVMPRPPAIRPYRQTNGCNTGNHWHRETFTHANAKSSTRATTKILTMGNTGTPLVSEKLSP